MKSAIVIYESMTGNTRRAGERIARELTAAGVPTASCPITNVDYAALAAADMVIVGSWTDGLFVVGQRPGRAGRLWMNLPAIDRMRSAVYCTYALAPGKTLEKLGAIVTGHGGDLIGGYAIRRNAIEEGAATFVERLLDAVPADAGA